MLSVQISIQLPYISPSDIYSYHWCRIFTNCHPLPAFFSLDFSHDLTNLYLQRITAKVDVVIHILMALSTKHFISCEFPTEITHSYYKQLVNRKRIDTLYTLMSNHFSHLIHSYLLWSPWWLGIPRSHFFLSKKCIFWLWIITFYFIFFFKISYFSC